MGDTGEEYKRILDSYKKGEIKKSEIAKKLLKD